MCFTSRVDVRIAVPLDNELSEENLADSRRDKHYSRQECIAERRQLLEEMHDAKETHTIQTDRMRLRMKKSMQHRGPCGLRKKTK